MNVKLQIIRNEEVGRAFSNVWSKLRQAQCDKETSIGALMDHLDDKNLDQLDGASIRLERA
jgi:hypothetical protein